MKKLLLTGLAIASLIAVNIQAQPIAQDAQLYSRGVGYSGNLLVWRMEEPHHIPLCFYRQIIKSLKST